MSLRDLLDPPLLRDVARAGSARVVASLAGPAVRGFLLERGKAGPEALVRAHHAARLDWTYAGHEPALQKLKEAGVREQWRASDLPWSTDVDPLDPAVELIDDAALPLSAIPSYRALPDREKRRQRAELLAWMLSQSLHGEQGALLAACQVTEAVPGHDGKMFGAVQVMDEGRHVEVFHRYLVEKLGHLWPIDDNLYVIVDALVADGRWDIKFLGMQILVEGLALGAFATFRGSSQEPLLRDLLLRVITDEARHVHYGVLALQRHYTEELSEAERREREDWAFEMALLLRNRFLAHEFHDQYYGQAMARREWDALILGSAYLATFRRTMFRRIVPNLKRIGLLSPRIRPHYEALGLLEFEHEKAAPDLTAGDLG